MNLSLEGKRVLVSGSTRGIGLAIARQFAFEGAVVAVTSRKLVDATAIAEALPLCKSGIHVAAQCDFTNPGDVQELGLLLRRVWGCVDVVVANVGSGLSVADLIPAPEQFDRIMALNFGSAQLTAYTFFPLLQEVKGNLLFISSIAGIEAIGAPIGYATAKSAVLAFAKNLARKAAPFGIRVNCVAPGNVLFPGGSWEEKMIAQPERISHLIETTVPMQRFGKPEEIATCCVFLCSVAASFVTGAVLVADGGQTLHLN